MVVPPGLATLSLSTPGCSPVAKHHFGGPFNGLGRQPQSHLARQAQAHAAIGQRLDHHVHIRRTGTRKTGDGIQQFFFDRHGQAYRTKKLGHQFDHRRPLRRDPDNKRWRFGPRGKACSASRAPGDMAPSLRPATPTRTPVTMEITNLSADKVPRNSLIAAFACCGLTASTITSHCFANSALPAHFLQPGNKRANSSSAAATGIGGGNLLRLLAIRRAQTLGPMPGPFVRRR